MKHAEWITLFIIITLIFSLILVRFDCFANGTIPYQQSLNVNYTGVNNLILASGNKSYTYSNSVLPRALLFLNPVKVSE